MKSEIDLLEQVSMGELAGFTIQKMAKLEARLIVLCVRLRDAGIDIGDALDGMEVTKIETPATTN